MRNGSWRASWLAPRLRRSLTPAPSEAATEGMTRCRVLVVRVPVSILGRHSLLRREPADCALRRGKRLVSRRLAEREPFSVDELDVGDAEEGEEVAHVRRLRVGGRAGVLAAARSEKLGLLAGQEADRALLGVLEGG